MSQLSASGTYSSRAVLGSGGHRHGCSLRDVKFA